MAPGDAPPSAFPASIGAGVCHHTVNNCIHSRCRRSRSIITSIGDHLVDHIINRGPSAGTALEGAPGSAEMTANAHGVLGRAFAGASIHLGGRIQSPTGIITRRDENGHFFFF